jgi:epoxide hydrolase-like predicted phosphatase
VVLEEGRPMIATRTPVTTISAIDCGIPPPVGSRLPCSSMSRRFTALVVDFGGVLTTSIWPAFAAFCETEGLAPETVRELFRGDAEALKLLRGLETGELEDAEFETRFGAVLGVNDSEGLITRMFAGLRPEEAMIDAVRAAGDAGLKTGLISNSWGLGIYDRAPIDLFDATVISGDVGLHKPQPEIYTLACERLEVQPADAVFVDDLRENCDGAEAVGMTALLHRDPPETVAKLEELFELELSSVPR